MTAAQPVLHNTRPQLIPIDGLSICCWRCDALLRPIAPECAAYSETFVCRRCGVANALQDGIWRSLASEEASKFERFIREYELVRAAESRGSADSEYYLALPFEDMTGKLPEQWKIRAATFRHMERHIIAPLAARRGRPLRILDLGAGNGWLSYRLSLLGHRPVAVDLLTNERDGLGAAMHYAEHLPSMFPRVQASLDQLPFPNEAFDLAIFNASFHYSTRYARTLGEALRCVREDGQVAIADTPWYRHEASGLRMVEEKHAYFKAAYGFASDSLPSEEFLTPQRLDRLASTLRIGWRVLKPFYGIDWALRPLRAKLARRRPPSKFRIFVAEVSA